MSPIEARVRRHGAALVFVMASLWLAACATTRPAPPKPGDIVELRGLASWYGDEFAGRPTANGEIFDSKQMTAAHRTLPFGTMVEITYLKTGRSTRVRINDRGPFVGNRIIDLSFAAAREIGMMEDGIGEVQMAILSVGAGEREPPKPYNVTIPAAAPPVEPAISDAPPRVASSAPPPSPAKPRAEPPSAAYGEPVIISEEIDPPAAQPAVAPPPPTVRPPAAVPPPPPAAPPREEVRPAAAVQSGWAVQLGAFSVEANAVELKAKAERVSRPVSIHRVGNLHRVRVGPWAARSRAIEEKERLEDAGFQGVVVSVN